jgi:dTDP-4-amino-4,6-dideoxygalactose transaminase
VVSLPLHPQLSDSDLEAIVAAVQAWPPADRIASALE